MQAFHSIDFHETYHCLEKPHVKVHLERHANYTINVEFTV